MLDELKNIMDSIGVKWAVCGGDAIDLFVGQQTRAHKDIDVAVFWEDREQIISAFLQEGWRVFEPDRGLLREITSLKEDLRTEDNLWCIWPESDSYQIRQKRDNFYEITTERKQQDVLDYIEVLFNREQNGRFIYKRNPAISLTPYLYYDANGIPYLAPEMVLLYKSIFVRFVERPEYQDMVENYRHDFTVAVERFDGTQKKWLKEALTTCYPAGHEWLDRL